MYQKLKLSILLLLFCATSSIAQDGTLKGMKVLKMPSSYVKPAGPTGDLIKYDPNSTTSKLWVVYSDRQDNVSYKNKNLTDKFTDLDYLSAYYVVEKEGSSLHLAKFDFMAHPGNGVLNDFAEDCGWVDENKMLLWNGGILNPKNKIIIKGLAVFHYEVLKNPESYFQSNNIKLYSHPNIDADHMLSNELRMFQFVFIFKEENGAYLIGKQSRVNVQQVSMDILGWVDKKTIQKWDGRVCIEPNRKPSSVNDRKSKKILASIFSNVKKANSYADGAKDVTALWDDDPLSSTIDARFKRFPVLDRDPSGVIKTGFQSPIIDERGKVLASIEEKNNSDKLYMKNREEKKNINIIFVIDGNPENKSFVRPIIESIKLNYDYLGDNTSNKYYFGSVIYRKDAYKDCNGLDKSIKVKDLTNQYRELTTWLGSSLNEELCPIEDEKAYTNLNEGLNRATRMLSDKKNNTNIMILIGGAGSEDTEEMNSEVLTKKIASTYSSLLVFQVNYLKKYAYEKFYDDVQNMVFENVNTISQELKTSTRLAQQYRDIIQDPVWNKDSTYDWFIERENSPVYGSLSYVEPGHEMSVSRLTNELKQTIASIELWNNRLIRDLDNKIQGMGNDDKIKVNPAMVLFLKNSGIGLDDNILNKISGKSYQFYVEGYTSIAHKDMHDNLFSYQLLMARNEYDAMKDAFTRLYESRSFSNLSVSRKKLKKAYLEVLSSYYGKNQIAMRKLTITQANNLLAGLPNTVRSKTINDYRIDDITSKKALPDQEFLELLQRMSAQVNKLKQVSVYDHYQFKNFDETMYWVPIEFLP